MGINKRIQNLFVNLFLLCVSMLVCLVAGEVVCRIFLEPVDYLRPELIENPKLRYHIEPGSAGHDQWGFRNVDVPDSADLVIIGDSQTYGVSAPASHSWPRLLAEESDRTVYNLSLGGYTPIQYYYLLTEYAIRLAPDTVIIALYPGNDFLEAYSMVYEEKSRDYWTDLQSEEVMQKLLVEKAYAAPPDTLPVVAFRGVRTFFEQNSILYRAAIYSPLGDLLRRRMMKSYRSKVPQYLSIEVAEKNLATAFQTDRRHRALDINDSRVLEGIRIVKEILSRVATFSKEHRISIMIVLIPVKEQVFAPYIAGDDVLAENELMQELLKNEAVVRGQFIEYCMALNLPVLDLLPAMRDGLETEAIYPSFHDGHPNKAGNLVLAKAVAAFLAE